MKSKSIMIQGTGSSVGKSIICAALCRIFTQDGYNVNPFKSQNMSSIFHVTKDGNKIAISQALQAYACKKEPLPIMNPVLLIPTADNKSQVILTGEFYKEMEAEEYFSFKPLLKEKIAAVYQQLSQDSDIVIIEGAGSPAEINLKREDFVNMGMAKIADAPVILVGDIDRGGVFASLAGTMLLLDDEERERVKGVIINKFRGSYKLLEPGLRMLEEIIKVPVLGVIPYVQHNLPEEDSLGHMHSHLLVENIYNEKRLDLIADSVRNSLNMDKIYEILEA
ncbi:MAG: cobyric acid synthase [Clostridiales bacterium]|nr:cobyric acid synthase [Clostridiales bacterium]